VQFPPKFELVINLNAARSRRRGDRKTVAFVAVHESGSGPQRRFSQRSEADAIGGQADMAVIASPTKRKVTGSSWFTQLTATPNELEQQSTRNPILPLRLDICHLDDLRPLLGFVRD
jgi:hypothetical protein